MTNIAEFIAEFFGARLVTDSFESDVTVGIAVTPLLANNPRRVALIITNTGQQTITLGRLNTVTTTTGKMLAPGDDFNLYWYNELREIEKVWFAIAPMAGGTLHLREVMFV